MLNNLPILIITKIVSLLNLKDRCKLKLLNKKFRTIINNHIQPKLLICESDFLFKNQFNERDLLSVNKNFNFELFFIKNVNQKIEYLEIYFVELNQISLNNINLFEQLKLIKICDLDIQILKLELPQLRILTFKNVELIDYTLKLNCPKLMILILDNFYNEQFIEFKYSQSIRILKCKCLYKNFDNLINLEKLIIQDTKLDLFKFKKLKILQIYPINLNLINQLNENKNKNLNIFVNGFKYPNSIIKIPYECSNQFNLIYINKNKIQEINTNLSKLKLQILYDVNIQYSELINYKFCNYFINIKRVKVIGKVKSNNLIQFLKQCKQLNQLYLKSNSLKQNFFNQLTTIKTIKKLEISTKLRIKFNFIQKFHLLIELHLQYFKLPIRSIYKIFLNCFFIKEFYFYTFKLNNNNEFSNWYNSKLRLTKNNSLIEIGTNEFKYGKTNLIELLDYLRQINLINKFIIER